ncbi:MULTISPECIES: hypothetical protein [unclassified Streptomyces]|uniref:hypothetical protein n=1 Tax=unclassified Streptomyces TaxID=2593676 RepID=UPI003321FA3D
MPRQSEPVVGVEDFLAAVMRAVSRAEEAGGTGPDGPVDRQAVLARRPIVTVGLTYQSAPGAGDVLLREAEPAREEPSDVSLRLTHEDATRAEHIAASVQQVPFQENIAKVWLREEGAADRLAASLDTLGAVADAEVEFASGLVGQVDDSVLENLMLMAGVAPHNMSTLLGVATDQNLGLGELLIRNSSRDTSDAGNGEFVMGTTFRRGAGIALVGAALLGVAAVTGSPVAAGAGTVLVVVGAALMLQ